MCVCTIITWLCGVNSELTVSHRNCQSPNKIFTELNSYTVTIGILVVVIPTQVLVHTHPLVQLQLVCCIPHTKTYHHNVSTTAGVMYTYMILYCAQCQTNYYMIVMWCLYNYIQSRNETRG